MQSESNMSCRICNSDEMTLIRSGVSDITMDDVKITDSRYGTTLPLYRCVKCGFIQSHTDGVLELYENLEDREYVESSAQRSRQFQKIIKQTSKYINAVMPKVLDIGAGTGLFIVEANEAGWQTQGLEPSRWLSSQAQSYGVDVINGTFPHEDCEGPYDAIFLTDVIEHLENPADVVGALSSHLDNNGVVFVTTPNVSSIMAKLLGRKWWHYRIAHIGYYNKKTLTLLMARGGLTPVKFMYAKWCFDGGYIFKRLSGYLPFLRGKKCPAFIERMTITVNFFDSYLAVFKKNCGDA